LAVGFVGEDEESLDEDFIIAVFPSCVLGKGSFSEGEEEVDD
jgi:hypothetical protein